MSEVIKSESLDVPLTKAGPWWHAPMHIAVHIFFGTAIFAVIALAAIGLALLTAWAKTLTYGGQPYVGSLLIDGLIVGEYTLFVVDLALFLVFIAKAAWRMLKEL